jgi:hypothetical protein
MTVGLYVKNLTDELAVQDGIGTFQGTFGVSTFGVTARSGSGLPNPT